MKKIILGLIIGFLLGSAVVGHADDIKILANKASFPILVNGKQLNTSEKPAVVINGSTYLPLKTIGSALSVPVSWNSNKNRVEVGSTPQDTVSTSTSTSNISLNILNRRYVKASEVKNLLPFPNFRFRLIEIEITNNGTATETITPKDFKINYKLADDTEKKVFDDLKIAGAVKVDGNIVKGEILTTAKDSGLFADTEIKFGEIAPGQTLKGTIMYDEADTNIDWFEVALKDKVTAKSK